MEQLPKVAVVQMLQKVVTEVVMVHLRSLEFQPSRELQLQQVVSIHQL